MKKHNRLSQKPTVFIILLIGLVFFVINACSQRRMKTETEKTASQGKLLVLPFQNMAALYGTNVSIRCPVCGKVFITGEVSSKSADFLTDRLVLLLRGEEIYKKIVVGGGSWGNADLMTPEVHTMSERNLMREAGKAANADAVMAAYLYRFHQRVGSKFSADTPASVAFGLHLIDVKTGRRLWDGHFDETQRSLSENLFRLDKFIERKASWITAEEMATSGLKEILGTLQEK